MVGITLSLSVYN